MQTIASCSGILATLTVALAQAAGPASDEELAAVYGDAELISIATGTRQPLRLAPSVASVITAADIKALGISNLERLLEGVPGLHVTRGGANYEPQYVMRGIVSGQTPQLLLLQNGQPMTTMLVGNKGQMWGDFPAQQIARVEIIRGPGSALYGAEAYSGVINIITKTAADLAALS
ncbi:TonB-dependent receptor plug domain-containing protein [Roseateles oligotrophus]|uniref:TonB-dependent receptor plug domain-containing protein n=1 Tax=Roseateles oligotrophus TaxID=1769250 RepID=A0ABT2YGL5_9BURK|nr:TonB-dependent receptor plug domain-containing protein [Roseateles oligotrophus]MCV2369130.1 TonB-dependent receptor plug domain-containing protein [Roseateles oligotrophus]